jgi:hypothetical protein
MTGYDITASLRNPVKELRKSPPSFRCRNRLFDIHFPYSKKPIAFYILNVHLPLSQSDLIRSIPHSPLRRWRAATRPSESSSPSARHASTARRRPGGTSDPWSIIHWAIAGRQAVGGSLGTRHSATRGQWAVFLAARRSAMPIEIARHEGFHEIRIVSVDGQLQLGCFMREALERFHVGLDVSLEPWPAEQSADMGNLELSRGLGYGMAGTL